MASPFWSVKKVGLILLGCFCGMSEQRSQKVMNSEKIEGN